MTEAYGKSCRTLELKSTPHAVKRITVIELPAPLLILCMVVSVSQWRGAAQWNSPKHHSSVKEIIKEKLN